MRLGALAAVVAVGLLSGCGAVDDTVDDTVDRARNEAERLGAGAITDSISGRVRTELERVGVELQGNLDCNSDVALSVLDQGITGSVDCSGTTVDDAPVEARFAGEFGAGSCTGELVVTVAGEERVRSPDLQACG